MNEDKKKRLEEKGWVFEDTEEFLGCKCDLCRYVSQLPKDRREKIEKRAKELIEEYRRKVNERTGYKSNCSNRTGNTEEVWGRDNKKS